MAKLTICPTCGATVATNARFCPQCGYVPPERGLSFGFELFITIIFLGTGALVLFVLSQEFG